MSRAHLRNSAHTARLGGAVHFTMTLLALLTVALMAYLLHAEQERTRKAEKQVDYLLDQIASKTIEDAIKEAKQRERLLAEAKANQHIVRPPKVKR